MTTPRHVYWDACIFIKHLSPNADPKSKAIMDGIDEVVVEAEEGRTLIVTSSITRVEVLDCNLHDGADAKYQKFLRREVVQQVDVDPRIADAAHDIRVFYRKAGRDLGFADSIHLATACLRQATELWTLDGTGKRQKLIGYSGRIADRWDLIICAPHAVIGRLFPLPKAQAPPAEVSKQIEGGGMPSVPPAEVESEPLALPPAKDNDDKKA